jgi:hypothetical protein
MIRAARAALLGLIAAGLLILLFAGCRQASPNATRSVIGARLEYCTPDGRFFRSGHSDWLPTANCYYPPGVPEVRR